MILKFEKVPMEKFVELNGWLKNHLSAIKLLKAETAPPAVAGSMPFNLTIKVIEGEKEVDYHGVLSELWMMLGVFHPVEAKEKKIAFSFADAPQPMAVIRELEKSKRGVTEIIFTATGRGGNLLVWGKQAIEVFSVAVKGHEWSIEGVFLFNGVHGTQSAKKVPITLVYDSGTCSGFAYHR